MDWRINHQDLSSPFVLNSGRQYVIGDSESLCAHRQSRNSPSVKNQFCLLIAHGDSSGFDSQAKGLAACSQDYGFRC